MADEEVLAQVAPSLWANVYALAPTADVHAMTGESPGVTGIVFNTGDPDNKQKRFVVHTDGQLAVSPAGCTVIEDVPGDEERPASYAILIREDLIEAEPDEWRVIGYSVIEMHYDSRVDPAVLYDALVKIKREAQSE